MKDLDDIRSEYFTGVIEERLKLSYIRFNSTHNKFIQEEGVYEICFRDFEDMLCVALFKRNIGNNKMILDRTQLEETLFKNDDFAIMALFDDIVQLYNGCTMEFILEVLNIIFKNPIETFFYN
jgi:hypothetical protein